MNKLNKYSYLFLLYPILILTIVIRINSATKFAPERLIYFYLILYFFSYFINNLRFKSFYIKLVYLCSLILSCFEIGYVSIYKERITPSTAFIILETNTMEAKEYLMGYLNIKIIFWFLMAIVPSYFILREVKRLILKSYTFRDAVQEIATDLYKLITLIWYKFNKFLITVLNSRFKRIVYGIIVLILSSYLYVKANHYKYNPIYQLYSGYEKYTAEKIKYRKFLSDDNFNNVILNSVKDNDLNKKKTIILVIGESTTRNHLGIYHYYRNTTPCLNKIRKELVIFDNVISPHTHTIPSLGEVLTFGNRENMEAKYKGSIVQLMKHANYKTYWISNQVPIGINETMVAMIAKSSDYSHFTNLGGTKQLKILDGSILPYFKEAIKDKGNKKFIVVHLLGTHTNYIDRYPPKFNKFIDNPPTNYPSAKSYKIINEYDNAVLYNDYIISSIIKLIKNNTNKKETIKMVYLSDHGEDVYQTVNFTGHSEVIGSQPMFQIPFIFWSNHNKEIKKYTKLFHHKYMTDNLIYSIADIANISFNGMDKKLSIFCDSMTVRKRIIKNNLDYDVLFKK